MLTSKNSCVVSNKELWDKCISNQKITLEDIGIPSWRKDCNGCEYELQTLKPFCRSGIAYKHKDGYRWIDGIFLTDRECKEYNLKNN